MTGNYLIIALRNLRNNLLFSTLNIVGLSIGVACCLVIGLFVVQEYSYDLHNEKADRIFRVVNRQVEGANATKSAVTPGVLAPELKRSLPEVEAATRVGITMAPLIFSGKEPVQAAVTAVDSDFFRMFTVTFISSAEKNVLSDESILLSESESIKYFGHTSTIGEVVKIEGLADLRVSGVFKDFPMYSHIRPGIFISFHWLEKADPVARSWSFNSFYNYVLLPHDGDIPALNSKIDALIHRFTPASWKSFQYYLQSLRAIHLESDYTGNQRGAPGEVLLIGFSMVGLVILLLACFNYMNMATARSARRGVEVGVRKVVGARRSQLVGQFLIESFVLVTLAFLLGIFWADIFVPVFNAVTGWQLEITDLFTRPKLLTGLIVSLVLLTILAGSYPAFFLSRFIPASVLKGQRSSDASRRLRKALVVVQFTLTSVLVIVVYVIFSQTRYLQSRDMGFSTQHLLLMSTELNSEIKEDAFKNELRNVPGVLQVATASSFPVSRMNTSSIHKTDQTEEESLKVEWLFSDHDYIPTLGLKLVAGRNFRDNGSDETTGIIINERAAREMGWTAEEAVGKRIVGFIFRDSLPGEVIGVIRDFHITPLRKALAPLVIGFSNTATNYMIRIDGAALFRTRDEIEKKASGLSRPNALNISFMEDAIQETYAAERKTGQFLGFFTLLAILIGCTGLYALSAYEGERRIKELGIRKIMGATTPELLTLLSGNFLKLIAVSLVIASPLAWFLGNIWLQTFPYRIGWTPDIFIVSSLAVLLLGWITTLGQALRASRLKPSDALRYE